MMKQCGQSFVKTIFLGKPLGFSMGFPHLTFTPGEIACEFRGEVSNMKYTVRMNLPKIANHCNDRVYMGIP